MNIVGFCGLRCNDCDAYKASMSKNEKLLSELAKEWSTNEYPLSEEDVICFGCNTGKTQFIYCKECEIKKCATNKNLKTCADCKEYPCDKLSAFFKQFPECKERLDNIR